MEERFISSFISGVSEDMQAAIDLAEPKTLRKTIDVGRKHLLAIEAITTKSRNSTRKNSTPHQYRRQDSNIVNTLRPVPSSYQKCLIKLLTTTEMTVRREK